MDKEQPINLSPELVACPRHLEPFRDRWPEGYLLFSCTLFQFAIETDEMQLVTGGKAEKIEEALKGTPLCCWLPNERLLEAYEALKQLPAFSKKKRCRICGRFAHGAPFQYRNFSEGHVRIKRLCFRCVVYGTKGPRGRVTDR